MDGMQASTYQINWYEALFYEATNYLLYSTLM